MADTVYATFPNPHMAERAIGALLDHGADAACISLVTDQAMLNRPLAATDQDIDPVAEARHGITTTTGGDAAAGAMKGAGIGLGVGAIAALASLIIPGFGLVIGGGALAMALGAAAATTAAGAIAGGVAGYLADQGVPDKVAMTYQEELAAGRSLLALHLPCGDLDQVAVEQLLDKYGAANVGMYGPSMAATAQPSTVTDVVTTETWQAAPTTLLPNATVIPGTDMVPPPLSEQPVVGEALLPVAAENEFRQHYNTMLLNTGLPYSEFEPAYRYGWSLGTLPRYADRSWDDFEPEVRTNWEQTHPGTWERMKMSIRHGWDRFRAHV